MSMPYNLRHGSELRKPVRFQSESNDESIGSPDSQNHGNTFLRKVEFEKSADNISSPAANLAVRNFPFTSLPPFSSQQASSQSTSRAKPPVTFAENPSMANTKYVRKYRKRVNEVLESQHDDAAPIVQSGSRSTGEHAAPPIYPSTRPAAFPSLSTEEPPPEPMQDYGRHGLWQRMEAHKNSNQERIKQVLLQVDMMYDNERFPDNMTETQKAWYAGLKERWLPNDTHLKVSCLPYIDSTSWLLQSLLKKSQMLMTEPAGRVPVIVEVPSPNHHSTNLR